MADELKVDKEFSELWPALAEEERDTLKASLRQDGCLSPIILWQGHDKTILDGHHRYWLCKQLKIDFPTKVIKLESRDDAIGWILRHQTGRRNLTESQRGIMAAKLATLGRGNPTGGNQHQGGNGPSGSISSTVTDLAEQFGVGTTTIKAGKTVLAEGAPSLQKAVTAGDVPIRQAAVIAEELPKAEQAKIVKQGPEAVAATASKLRERKATAKARGKPKQGQVKGFNDTEVIGMYGKLIRKLDERTEKMGGGGGNRATAIDALTQSYDAYLRWCGRKK